MPPVLLHVFICSLLFSTALAQTTPVVPNSAQLNVVQPDTIRPVLPPATSAGGQAQIFAPPTRRKRVRAVEISEKLNMDGRLDEAAWQQAEPVRGFVQVDPQQGAPARSQTDVRVLFNRQYLYISASITIRWVGGGCGCQISNATFRRRPTTCLAW